MIDVEDKLQWLVDRAEIVETVYKYATGIDTREFELHRSIFTDEIEVDFSSYAGGQEGYVKMSADQWVEGLKGLFPGLDSTQHLMSNPRVTVDGDRAICLVYMQAEHFLANREGDNWHAIGGYYTDDLVRTAEGWKVSRIKLTIFWQRGNKQVMTMGAQRVTELAQHVSGSSGAG
jgi:hypothetical protein